MTTKAIRLPPTVTYIRNAQEYTRLLAALERARAAAACFASSSESKALDHTDHRKTIPPVGRKRRFEQVTSIGCVFFPRPLKLSGRSFLGTRLRNFPLILQLHFLFLLTLTLARDLD